MTQTKLITLFKFKKFASPFFINRLSSSSALNSTTSLMENSNLDILASFSNAKEKTSTPKTFHVDATTLLTNV